MPVITQYRCSKCGRGISSDWSPFNKTGIGSARGPMTHCPHCGVYLRGLSEQHMRDLTTQYVLALALTVFFVVGAVAAPPAILLAIVTGIWAYSLHRKRKSASGKP